MYHWSDGILTTVASLNVTKFVLFDEAEYVKLLMILSVSNLCRL